MEKLYTVEEAAEYLQVVPATVREWLRKGEMKGVKLGGRIWRIREQDLVEYLDKMAVQDEPDGGEDTSSDKADG